MNYRIGIAGSAGRSKRLSEELTKAAQEVGNEVARQGDILVNGGCMGVSYVASEAACQKDGMVLGYSPAKDFQEHLQPPISYPYPPAGMHLIFTGTGKVDRNVGWIRESEGVIFVGGGIGTFNEFTLAVHESKVIGILDGIEGVCNKMSLDFLVGDKFSGVIVRDKDPKILVKRVIDKIKKIRKDFYKREIPLTFQNDNDKQLMGVFHFPGEHKTPLVVVTHGIGKNSSEDKFVELGRKLSDNNIACFRFDFEGCGNSEGEFKDLTVKSEVTDLECAVKSISKFGDLAFDRFALVGDSLGAVVNCLFAVERGAPVKTLVLWSPAFNQGELLRKWNSEEEIKRWCKDKTFIKGKRKFGIDYLEENIEADYSYLFAKLSQKKIKVMIVHGDSDEDVPASYSKKLANKYPNVSLRIIKGADHKKEEYYSRRKLVEDTQKYLFKQL